jgi:BirA family biotin operon repressor/biotin-[acetyl-CoA-carboxylase] ligase
MVPTPSPPWLIRLDTCPSTNTWALDHVEALAHGAVVWTERQTAGRGRDGRTWHAPPGVLTFSTVLDLAPAAGPRLALACGLAVAHALEDLCPGLRIDLKWPNDCFLRGGKLAGILCEAATPARMVIGIGVNLDPRWELAPGSLPLAAAGRAIGLAEVVGEPPTGPRCIAAIRRYLLEAAGLIGAGGWAHLLPELEQRDRLRGRWVQALDGDRRWRGLGAGIDRDGRLLLDCGGGAIAAIAAGHVEEVVEAPSGDGDGASLACSRK